MSNLMTAILISLSSVLVMPFTWRIVWGFYWSLYEDVMLMMKGDE